MAESQKSLHDVYSTAIPTQFSLVKTHTDYLGFLSLTTDSMSVLMVG